MTKLFTLEDAKASFNLFCCVYGIGTLGMPANFSRAGPAIAVVALLFMAFANVYASVVCSKVMLHAPKSVRTFGDLGEWCMGKWGRWITVIAQMGVCLLVPCAFLVLGGILLSSLFPGAFKDSTWIILMAISLLPVCLTPTLKEGAGAAFAGCLGTILADIIGVGVLLHGMRGHPSVPSPDISFDQVAHTFGNLSLAYAAAIVIPALQRQHSHPERMPRVIGVTLTFVSMLFMALAGSGYSAVGCQISGNLLFTIVPGANGLTKLGFKPNQGMFILAYLFMQLHITIAFAIILNPALYMCERLLLGMHKKKSDDIEALNYAVTETPAEGEEIKVRASKGSVVSMADIERDQTEEDESEEYKGQAHKYVPLRIAIVAILTIVSVLLKDRFLDLQDFIGASCITICCLILPIVFYFIKLWTTIPLYEKISGTIIVLFCLVIGGYETYKTGKNLFNPDAVDPTDPIYPFCAPSHEFSVYYNYTAVHG